MSRYDLAVFDFDGTLADSADWFFGALNEVAGRFGFRSTTEDERQALRYLDNREIIRRLQVPMWKLPAIARHMRRRVTENIDSIRLFPGIPEALSHGGDLRFYGRDPEPRPSRPNFLAMQLSSASSVRRPSTVMAGRPVVSTMPRRRSVKS